MFPVVITRLFSLFVLGLSDAWKPCPFSCSVDPLTVTAASALLSHHVALPTYCSSVVVVYFFFFFNLFSSSYLAHCSRRRLQSFVAFLTSRKSLKSRGGCWRGCGSPFFFPRVTDRRLPSTDAAPESPEAGWCDRLPRPADSWISRLFLRSLRPRSPLKSSLEPSYVNIVNLSVWVNLIWEYLLNLNRCIACNSPRDGSSLPVSFRTHTQHPCSLPTEGQGGVTGQK